MYHKIVVAGRLGRDPEMRYMPDGKAVTNFSLATNDGWGENKKTIWFRVSIWGKRAEVANQYMSKGSSVLVEGRLRTDQNGGPNMFTRRDGTVGANFEITATDFAFLGGRQDAADYAAQGGDSDDGYSGGGGGGGSTSSPAVEEDDIPF